MLIILVAAFLFVKEERNAVENRVLMRSGNTIRPVSYTHLDVYKRQDVEVPTLDGKVSYHVHDGTQPGDVFRLKGKGIQGLGSRMRGDQYVQVTVEVPKNLSKRQKEILEELDQACLLYTSRCV